MLLLFHRKLPTTTTTEAEKPHQSRFHLQTMLVSTVPSNQNNNVTMDRSVQGHRRTMSFLSEKCNGHGRRNYENYDLRHDLDQVEVLYLLTLLGDPVKFDRWFYLAVGGGGFHNIHSTVPMHHQRIEQILSSTTWLPGDGRSVVSSTIQ